MPFAKKITLKNCNFSTRGAKQRRRQGFGGGGGAFGTFYLLKKASLHSFFRIQVILIRPRYEVSNFTPMQPPGYAAGTRCWLIMYHTYPFMKLGNSSKLSLALGHKTFFACVNARSRVWWKIKWKKSVFSPLSFDVGSRSVSSMFNGRWSAHDECANRINV